MNSSFLKSIQYFLVFMNMAYIMMQLIDDGVTIMIVCLIYALLMYLGLKEGSSYTYRNFRSKRHILDSITDFMALKTVSLITFIVFMGLGLYEYDVGLEFLVCVALLLILDKIKTGVLSKTNTVDPFESFRITLFNQLHLLSVVVLGVLAWVLSNSTMFLETVSTVPITQRVLTSSALLFLTTATDLVHLLYLKERLEEVRIDTE